MTGPVLLRGVDRTHGVDHPPRVQLTRRRGDRLPRGQAPAVPGGAQSAALVEDRGAAPAVDGTVDSSPAEEGGVGGVDDRVDALPRDVALNEDDRGHVRLYSSRGGNAGAPPGDGQGAHARPAHAVAVERARRQRERSGGPSDVAAP